MRTKLRHESLEARRMLAAVEFQYDAETGSVAIVSDTPMGTVNIVSENRIFVGDRPAIILPPFDVFLPERVFFLRADHPPTSVDFGPMARPGLSKAELQNDLSFVIATAPSGTVNDVEIVVANANSTVVDAPTLISLSVEPGQVINGGNFTIEFEFDEPVQVEGDILQLFRFEDQDRPEQIFRGQQFELDESNTVLTIDFNGVTDGRYNLAIDPAFFESSIRDVDGHLFDGDWAGSLPSGDGFAGGSFAIELFVDIDETVADAPLTFDTSANHRTFQSSVLSGYITTGNVDELVYEFTEGHVVQFEVTANAELRMMLFSEDTGQVVAPLSVGIGSFGPFVIPETGEYRLAVGYAEHATPYRVRWTLGEQTEVEQQGEFEVNNNEPATAEEIVIGNAGSELRSTLLRGQLTTNDEDWYAVTLQPGERLSSRFVLEDQALGNRSLVMELIDASGDTIQQFFTSQGEQQASADEFALFNGLVHPNDEASATYYLRVAHSNLATDREVNYALQVAINLEIAGGQESSQAAKSLTSNVPLIDTIRDSSRYTFSVREAETIRLEISTPDLISLPNVVPEAAGNPLTLNWRLENEAGETIVTGTGNLTEAAVSIEALAARHETWSLVLYEAVPLMTVVVERLGVSPNPPIGFTAAPILGEQGDAGVIVIFDQPIDRRNLQASHFRVGDETATDLTWQDANRAIIRIPFSVPTGVTIQVAEGAALTLAGSPITQIEAMLDIRTDANVDGVISAEDIDFLCQRIQSGAPDLGLDYNRDGQLDLGDYQYLPDKLFSAPIGDANLDGKFDSRDFVVVFAQGKYESDGRAGWAEGDWNCDGKFDTADLVAAFAAGHYKRS